MRHTDQEISLTRLHSTEQAVRVTPAMEDAHDELVASIKAHGLLEPLVVKRQIRNDDQHQYDVVAGNRRLAALLTLVQHGELPAEATIRCTVLDADANATEVALAENTVRVAMHPADQAKAFRSLAEGGSSPEDIGNRFGLAPRTVAQRLRLGRLAKPILDAYREGEIDREMAHAYATTENTEAQLEIFARMKGSYSAHPGNVLHMLEQNSMRSDSSLAQFVGAKRYAEAGGMAEPTLFADYSLLSDIDLLKRLAREKMERAAARVKGWKWVETTIESNVHELRNPCTQLYAQPGEPTAEEQEVLDAAHRWDEAHSETEWEDLSEDEQAEGRRLEEEYHKVRREVHGRRAFTPEQMAAAGVILFIDHGGKTGRVEGLVRKGDPVPGREDEPSDTGRADAKPAKPKTYSQGLSESMTELRNAVIRDGLRGNPEIAADVLVFNMVLSLFTGAYGRDDDPGMRGFYPDLPLAVRREHASRLGVSGASPATNSYLEGRTWKTPGFIDPKKSLGEMFEEYRRLPAAVKVEIAAEVTARMLLCNPGGPFSKYDVHAAVAEELQLDWAARLLEVEPDVWNAETLWGRLRKDQIIEEAGPYLGDEWVTAAGKMKKKELAADAAAKMRDHPGYLPRGFDSPPRPEAKE